MSTRRTIVFLVLVLLSYVPFILDSALAFVLTAAFFFYVALKLLPLVNIHGFTELGLSRHRNWALLLVGGAFVGCTFNLLVYVILSRLELVAIEVPTMGELLPIALFASVTAGFTAAAEEIIFRGYLARVLRPHLSWTRVTLFISILFTLYHLPQGGLPLPYWIRFFLMGIVFTVPLIVTKSLWMSIGIHFGGNFTFYILLTDLGLLATERSGSVIESIGWASVAVASILLGSVALTGRYVRREDGRVPL